MNKFSVRTLLAVVPVVAAGLYLLGATYHQGYLDGFALDDSLFQIPTDRSLFFGFFSLLSLGIIPATYALLALALLVIAAIAAAILFSNKTGKVRWEKLSERFRFRRIEIKTSESISNFVSKGSTLYINLASVFLLLISLLLIALLSLNGGRKQAAKEIENFANLNGNYVELLVKSAPLPVRGKLIICGQSLCAFWLGDTTLVVHHENIVELKVHKWSTNTNN